MDKSNRKIKILHKEVRRINGPKAEGDKTESDRTKDKTSEILVLPLGDSDMEVQGKTGQENGPKAERETGLRTREKIYKSGIKLAALKFQTRERHQKYRACLRGTPTWRFRGKRSGELMVQKQKGIRQKEQQD